MLAKLPQLCFTLCDSVKSRKDSLKRARLLCPCNFPGKNTGEGCYISTYRGSSWPTDRTYVSCGYSIAGVFFTSEPPGKPRKWGQRDFLVSAVSQLSSAQNNPMPEWYVLAFYTLNPFGVEARVQSEGHRPTLIEEQNKFCCPLLLPSLLKCLYKYHLFTGNSKRNLQGKRNHPRIDWAAYW